MTITDEKYLLLTTFKKDGTPKPTPIWVVADTDGSPCFTTWIDSWKVKRIRNNPSVRLQPCDMKGVPNEGTEEVSAKAQVVGDSDFTRIAGLIREKYGLQVSMIQVFGMIRRLLGKGGTSDAAVRFTLD